MKEFTAKTVELAIELGLKELGLSKDNAIIKVIEEGSKGGVFGIGSKNAIVEIEEKVSDGIKAQQFLEELFIKMNITATTELNENEEKVSINIISTDSSKIIGYRGEVLDSLQTLASAVANIQNEEYKRVVVDCENYREKREETLKSLAQRLAEKALKLGKRVALEPMNPYERRIIHSVLSENEKIKTESEGKEPNRYIVIIPENCDPNDTREIKERNFSPNKGNRRNNRDKDRKGDKKNSGFKSDMIRSNKKTSGFGTFLGNSLKGE